MRDTVTIAQQLASTLAPFLPYLTGADEEAWQEISDKLGADAWNRARAIWERLYPGIEVRESVMEALRDVSQSPEDADTLAAFRLQLKKLLAEDDALADDLTELLQGMRADSEQETLPEDFDAVKNSTKRDWIINGNWNIVRLQAPGASLGLGEEPARDWNSVKLQETMAPPVGEDDRAVDWNTFKSLANDN